jgi:hypothetical protein
VSEWQQYAKGLFDRKCGDFFVYAGVDGVWGVSLNGEEVFGGREADLDLAKRAAEGSLRRLLDESLAEMGEVSP